MDARGFTLVELMVTLAVLAVVVGIALPAYQQWLERSQRDAAAGDLYRSVAFARGEATARNRPMTLRPFNGRWAEGWEVFADETGDGEPDALPGVTDGILAEVRFTGAELRWETDPASLSGLRFGRNGRPTASARLVLCGATAADSRELSLSPAAPPHLRTLGSDAAAFEAYCS